MPSPAKASGNVPHAAPGCQSRLQSQSFRDAAVVIPAPQGRKRHQSPSVFGGITQPRARPRPERVEGPAARTNAMVRPSEKVRGQASSPLGWRKGLRGNLKERH